MARVIVPVTPITPPAATLTTALAGANNDLAFTAADAGPVGNNITITYVVAGASTPFSLVVTGTAIVVNSATDGASAATTTASQVLAAIEANRDADALVSVELAAGNTGAGIIAALSATPLAGGSLGIPDSALVNGDATNDHYLTGNDGQVFLEVVSSDGGAQTVTIHYAPNALTGAIVDPYPETIAAGGSRKLGPFPQRVFNQNQAKDVYFDPSVSTNLKFRAYRLVKVA